MSWSLRSFLAFSLIILIIFFYRLIWMFPFASPPPLCKLSPLRACQCEKANDDVVSALASLAPVANALVAAWSSETSSASWPQLRAIRTRTTDSFFMVCYSGDHVCDDINKNGYRAEWATGLGVLIEKLDPGRDIFLDFGANTGFFGLAAAARGVQVLAVEPANSHICRVNALINHFSSTLYELHPVALVERRGAGPMTQIVPWSNLGGSTLVKKEATRNWTGLFEESEPHRDIVVNTATIDDVVRSSVLLPRRAVRLVKMDIEGFDIFAWRGGQELLASGLVFMIVAEWYPPFLVSAGVEPREYFDLLMRHGYWAFSAVEGGDRILPQDIDTFCARRTHVFDIRFELRDKIWPPVEHPLTLPYRFKCATEVKTALGVIYQSKKN